MAVTPMRDGILWSSILGRLAVVVLLVAPAPGEPTGAAPGPVPDAAGIATPAAAADVPVIAPASPIPAPAPVAVATTIPAAAVLFADPVQRTLWYLRRSRPVPTMIREAESRVPPLARRAGA